jgi:hypothetical protein
MKGAAAALLFAVSVSLARAAYGDADATGSTPVAAPAASARRSVPDYSGRGPEPTTAGDVLLWVPRVILSPVYFVTEFVVRWPLSVAIPAAERIDLPRKIYDFFTFGPDHKAGVLPVGLVEFDFNPSVGVFAFWDDAFFAGHQLRLHAEAWPTDWYAASMTEGIQVDADRSVQFRVSELHRPDRVFYGVGPDALQSYQSRYTQQTFDAGGALQWRFWRQSRIEAGAGVRVADLSAGHYGTDPSLPQEAATGAFAIPDGFDRGYTAEHNRLAITVDSRRAWPPFGDQATAADKVPGSGVHLDLLGEQGTDFRRSPASGWIRYGGTAGGYVDLSQHGRVLGAAVTTVFADPTGANPIPFTELATLGGDGPMRGYYLGRLFGRSAATAALHYVWPVAPWLGGSIETAVGNVFDAHLAGLRPGRLRFSGSIGLSTVGTGDYPFELIFGCGSETFEHGGQIDSFRFALSANHGF